MATFLRSITNRLIDFQYSYSKIICHRNSKKRPNGLRLSRLAGYAGLGSSILRFPQRTYQRRLQPKANSVPTACWASTIWTLVDDISDYRLRKITNTELRKRLLNNKLVENEFRMVYSNHSTARLRPIHNTSWSGGFPRQMEEWTQQASMATFFRNTTSRLLYFQ